MNFKFLTGLVVVFYCLLFISLGQKDFNSTVLAQESTRQESDLTNLSKQEKAGLKQGKVVLKGEKGNYLGQVLTTGNINTAWEVLTDYDNFDRFLPNVASSKIISEQGNRLVFEQINVVDLWLFKQEFRVQLEAIKTKPTKVDFKIVDGDLKKLIGRWQLEEVSPGKILVSHAVTVEPGSDTEKPFFYGVYESSLEDTLKAIAFEINKRSKS